MMNKKSFLIFGMFLLVMTSLFVVSAAPPFESIIISDSGLEIESPNFDTLKQNEYHIFTFRVYNVTNNIYLNDDDVNCDLGIINNLGENIFNKQNVTEIGKSFSVNVSGGNFSDYGIYHEGINCITIDESVSGGVKTISFAITPNGYSLEEGFAILLIGAIFIILLLFIMTIKGMIQTDDFGWSFGFMNIAYLLLNIFFFVGWKIFYNYVYTIPTIGVALHSMWIVSNIIWIPFILSQVAYLLLKMTDESQIKKLVKIGYSEDEASSRIHKNKR